MKQCLLITPAANDLWVSAILSSLSQLHRELKIIDHKELSSTCWGNVDLVILDGVVTNDLKSMISAIRARDSVVRIVVFSSVDDWKRAREAILAGAVDYTVKCLDEKKIVDILKKDLRRRVPPVAPDISEVRGVS